MNKLAIIPARGGSKRIPRKNIKFFLGKPIIAYSIEAALQSGLFDEVMVSTDDQEIAEIAQQHGASVPFMRSERNADDFATTVEVLQEVLESYKQLKESRFKYACCLYPTAPFISPERLNEGFLKMETDQLDTVFPIVAFSFPIWRGLKITNQKRIEPLWPEFTNKRSQDLEKSYHDAGQWYWFRTDRLKDSLYTSNSGFVELDALEVQDIDDSTDWQLAEFKYRFRQEYGKPDNYQS